MKFGGRLAGSVDAHFAKWQALLHTYVTHARGILLDFRDAEFANDTVLDLSVPPFAALRAGLVTSSSDRTAFRLGQKAALCAEVEEAAVFVAEGFRKLSHDASKPIAPATVLSRTKPLAISQDEPRFDFFVGTADQDVALVKIVGVCPDGAVGKECAAVIGWQLDRFVDALRPRGLIIDLRGFTYEWGDDLGLYPRQYQGAGSTTRFLVREGRRAFPIKAEDGFETIEDCIGNLATSTELVPAGE